MDEAMKLVADPLYLACMLIKNGDADGEVAGARNATGDVLRPAFQIVKTLPGVSVVSGAFIMILKDTTYGENGMFVFADCAATPCPTAEELGQIAVVSAQTAKAIAGFEDPRVAILSFSTKGSAKHELVDKVIEAGQSLGQKNTAFAIWVATAFLNPLSSVGPGCYILWQNTINSVEIWLYRKKGLEKAS